MKGNAVSDNQLFEIRRGDCLEVLRQLPTNHYHGLLSDPPYGLEFMGKDWDKAVPPVDVWREVHRVLRPGAFGLVFGGTRTWHRLAVSLEDAGFEVRDTMMWVQGQGFPKSHDVSKAIDRKLGVEREVVGKGENYGVTKASEGKTGYGDFRGEWDITAPSSDEARLWSGYGTALKPAWECVILVQKPVSITDLCGILALKIGEAICQLPKFVKDVENSSRYNLSEKERASAVWSVVEKCNSLDDLYEVMGMLPSESEIPMTLNIGLLWLDILGVVYEHQSMFTTETASSLITDLKTLNSLLGLNTPNVIAEAVMSQRGIGSSVSIAAGVFQGVSAKLRFTLEPSVVETAISRDGVEDLRPNWCPIFLIRKPTDLSFADNCLEWGCGALNIDGARVGTDKVTINRFKDGMKPFGDGAGHEYESNQSVGRWPANILFDELAAIILDKQSGVTTSGAAGKKGKSGFVGGYDGDYDVPYGDTGGASRFFYCSKANKRERELGLDDRDSATVSDGRQKAIDNPFQRGKTERKNIHPTVKPIDLNRYLATLLLPPTGGNLLVPYSGVASEVIGGLLAGWSSVTGIEREQEYVDIALRRIEAHTN